MSDDVLDKLGNYFVHFKILEKYGITFERFLHLYKNNLWRFYV